MDNTIVNIRFGMWHFQVERGTWKFTWTKNEYHKGYPDGILQVYSFFRWR